MKNQCVSLCPGCRKHCPAESPCCKYGRTYFKKHGMESAEAASHKKHKWEKNVVRDGLTWKMLLLSRRIKKDLRKGRITEDKLIRALNDAERACFVNVLQKMNACLKD